MEFSKAEYRLLCKLLVSSTASRPASIATLREDRYLFRRPGDFRHAFNHLKQNGLVASDDEWRTLYALQSEINKSLGSAASTAQAHFYQDDTLASARAEVCASPPDRAEFAQRADSARSQLKEHLAIAEKKIPLQLPSAQLTSAERIVAWLETTVTQRGDAADLALWQEWAGWWRVVARNNPDRIERAWEKAQRVPDLRKPERYMRSQISAMVREGLG